MPRSSVTSGSLIGGTVVPSGARPRSTTFGPRSHSHFHDSWRHSYWHDWWDPHHSHGSWSHWNWHGGYGSFGWNVSLWQPWSYHRNHYWRDCYFDSWWCSWSRPSCVATNYWWYPTTTYCPTYLYVPSSTVVYVERDPDPAPPASSVLVAGGGVDGGAIVRDSSTEDLAKQYVELGDFYFEVGRYKEAADAYDRAKSYAPSNASVHFAMADAAFAAGDYHYSAYLIGEAVRLEPSIVSADIDRRSYYAEPQRFDEQMAELEQYLGTRPYDAQAELVRGYNLRFSGKPTASIAAFRRVLEIAPTDRAAQAFLAALAPPNSEAVIR